MTWNAFRITDPLWRESTGHRVVPLTKGHKRGVWSFFDVSLSKRRVPGVLKRHRLWKNHLISSDVKGYCDQAAWIFLNMESANERRRYIVTQSLIGLARALNDPWAATLS